MLDFSLQSLREKDEHCFSVWSNLSKLMLRAPGVSQWASTSFRVFRDTPEIL